MVCIYVHTNTYFFCIYVYILVYYICIYIYIYVYVLMHGCGRQGVTEKWVQIIFCLTVENGSRIRFVTH